MSLSAQLFISLWSLCPTLNQPRHKLHKKVLKTKLMRFLAWRITPMNETIKKLLKRYVQLTSWFVANESNQNLSVDQFETVLSEIGTVETQLFKGGVSLFAIDK